MQKECVLLVACLCSVVSLGMAKLTVEYYEFTCPDVEQIVHSTMVEKQRENPVTAAGALRIFFHDCFVQGCDASVLIVSTATNKAEKDAEENLSLPGDGFDAFMRAKAAVEQACSGVVSCADIMAMATRDLVGLIGGPFWPVVKGRKDGRISLASQVPGNLPQPTMSVDQLSALFEEKGFTTDEMVILSGAHTVGFSHCDRFMKRIYSNPVDPTMNATYAAELRLACPNVNLDPTVVAFNDVTTPRVFDNAYFVNLERGLGLLPSDQMLWTDSRTRPSVTRLAASEAAFFQAWVATVQKLSMVGVKSGAQGEVRKQCSIINT